MHKPSLNTSPYFLVYGKEVKEKFVLHQNHIKRWFDKKSAGKKEFNMGDLILK